MSKNLPPAWDHGYALPGNVKAEGVQRRAFVTKWAPRGTYGTEFARAAGGYAQPKYVLEEGTGQGTFVTDWVPSATYMGPGVPHWMNNQPHDVLSAPDASGAQYVKVKSAMGDAGPVPSHVPFAAYGNRAASMILSKIQSFPPKQRKAALKKVLDAVDSRLWSRVDSTARGLIKRGMPPKAALARALSTAMSSGLGEEVVALGKGDRPASRHLSGLGCYGCGALTALGMVATSAGGNVAVKPTTGGVRTVDPSTQTPPVPVCTSDGLIFQFGARLYVTRPADKCTQLMAQDTATVLGMSFAQNRLYAGPFPIPMRPDPGTVLAVDWIPNASKAPDDLVAYLSGVLANKTFSKNPHAMSQNLISYYNGKPLPFYEGCMDPISVQSYKDWLAKLGFSNYDVTALQTITSGPNRDLPTVNGYPTTPVITFQHPVVGGQWGIWLYFTDAGMNGYYPDKQLHLWYMLAPLSYYKDALFADHRDVYDDTIGAIIGGLEAVYNFLDTVVSVIETIIPEVVNGLGGLACQLLSGPNGVKQGAAAGSALGPAGTAAGAAGAVIAQQNCAQPTPTASSPSWTTWAIAGAAGIAALLLLSSPKKKPKPPSGGAPP